MSKLKKEKPALPKEIVAIGTKSGNKYPVTTKSMKIEEKEDGKFSYKAQVAFEEILDFFLFSLDRIILSPQVEVRLREELTTIYTFLKKHLASIDIEREDTEHFSVTYKLVADSESTEEEREAIHKTISEYLRRPMIHGVLQGIIEKLKKEEDLKKQEQELKRQERELGKRERALKRAKKPGNFKRSGHLTDQILKYTYPPDQSPQLSIFDNLQDKTKKDIEGAGVEITEIVEGIQLSPSETKVIDCLCKLLHERSQITEPKKEDYYSGNVDYDIVEYGEGMMTPAPKLAFTLYELTKEYKGGEYVAGKDIENVKQILTVMDSKRFLLSYVETTRKIDGGRTVRKIEDFRKLLHIVKISQTEFSKEDTELSREEETVILLNPIFRRQIDSKFISYPNDINKRTIIAYGSPHLSEATLKLRDYLMRELSSKRYKPEITLNKLYYLLAEKWMRESRRKKVKEYTDKALETVKALGLLQSYETILGATGEQKIVFSLNKKWK